MFADHETHPDTELTSVSRELQLLLLSHLDKHPQLSLNAISKRCSVSEPTLRRIAKGKIKTDPSVDTVVDLLAYLYKQSDLQKIRDLAPPALKDFLESARPQTHSAPVNMQTVPELSEALQNPMNYLIYSLAANDGGVDGEQIHELFGRMGMGLAEEMVNSQLLHKNGDHFHAVYENFVPPLNQTRTHMKSLLDFLKPDKIGTSKSGASLTPMAHYMTNGVSKKAYQEIRKIQARAAVQCAKILFAPQNKGSIPAFLLVALDTLSNRTAKDTPSN